MECLLKLEAHLLSILAHGGEECHAHEWIITGQWRIHTIYGTLSTLRYLYLNPLRLRFLIFFPGLPLFFQRLANRESCGNNAINNNNRTDRSVYKLTVTISAVSLFDQFFVGWTDSDCAALSKSVDPPPPLAATASVVPSRSLWHLLSQRLETSRVTIQSNWEFVVPFLLGLLIT